MQTCPALRALLQQIRPATTSGFIVPSMIAGLLPPSSRVKGVRCSAAARMTFLPVTVPPVKKMWSKGGGQMGRFLRSAQHHLNPVLRQGGPHPVGHHLRGGRCLLRRLDHDAVSGSQCGDDRLHCQQQRKIPRCDDEDHPLGLVDDFRHRSEQLNRRRSAFRAHPIPQMAPHEGDLLADWKELRQSGLCFRLSPGITAEGLKQCILMLAKAGSISDNKALRSLSVDAGCSRWAVRRASKAEVSSPLVNPSAIP